MTLCPVSKILSHPGVQARLAGGGTRPRGGAGRRPDPGWEETLATGRLPRETVLDWCGRLRGRRRQEDDYGSILFSVPIGVHAFKIF